MVNPISKTIGKLCMPMLVKTDLKTGKALEILDDNKLCQFVYNKRKDVYKKYGITIEQVNLIVCKCNAQKRGVIAKVMLSKSKSTIRKAIKEGRVVFLGDDSVEYTAKKGSC